METNTKKKIMMEALRLFSLQGFEGTNLRDLAANINLSKSTIYRHYSSKEDILNHIIDEAKAHYEEKTSVINSDLARYPNNLQEFKEMVLKHVDFTINDPFIVMCRRFLTIEQYRSDKIAILASYHSLDGVKKTYEQVLSKLMDNRCIVKKDPELLSFEFICPITVLIGVIDRQPYRKKECLDLIDAYIDSFNASFVND